MVEIVDRTSSSLSITQTLDGRNIYSGGNANARRNTGAVHTILLHQTGPGFDNVAPSRFDSVICNYAVMRDGTVLYLRPIDHALNSVGTDQRAIDIEIAGAYPDYFSWVRRRPQHNLTTPSFHQIQKARELVRHLQGVHGVREILTHRHFTQKNCCGPHLWRNVGQWAINTLGLQATRGDVQTVQRYWGRAIFDIDPVDGATEVPPVESVSAAGAASEGAGGLAAPQQGHDKWAAWVVRHSFAHEAKITSQGIIGVYRTEDWANREAVQDRAWQQSWGWESWLRRPSRAVRLKRWGDGFFAIYASRSDAAAEGQDGEGIWRVR